MLDLTFRSIQTATSNKAIATPRRAIARITAAAWDIQAPRGTQRMDTTLHTLLHEPNKPLVCLRLRTRNNDAISRTYAVSPSQPFVGRLLLLRGLLQTPQWPFGFNLDGCFPTLGRQVKIAKTRSEHLPTSTMTLYMENLAASCSRVQPSSRPV